MTDFRRFRGTAGYLTSPSLEAAVNCALALERPLLIRGEPGTGKTMLAEAVAADLDTRLIHWPIKSTTRAQDGLYVYDTVARLYDSRFGEGDVRDIKRYIKLGPLGEAFAASHESSAASPKVASPKSAQEETRASNAREGGDSFGSAERGGSGQAPPDDRKVVLLIDEIDKGDLEFPNDLLHELDRMRFYISETKEEIVAQTRPVVIITSNAEKELPDAFLRRCVFHFIEFPDRELMARIVRVHHPDLETKLLERALSAFYALRDLSGLRKRPSTSELIDWIAALRRAGLTTSDLDGALPFLGTLLKREQDLLAYAEAQARGRGRG